MPPPPPQVTTKAAASPLQIFCGGDCVEYYFLVSDAMFRKNVPPLSSESKSKPCKQNRQGYIVEDGTNHLRHHHN
jgi:hypothetical protein